MSVWEGLSADLDEFTQWAKKVGDYHAQTAIYRFLRLKRLEQAKLLAADKNRHVEVGEAAD